MKPPAGGFRLPRFSEGFRTVLPFLLAAAACAGALPRAFEEARTFEFLLPGLQGSFLLYGFPSSAVNYDMPFFSVFMTALAAIGIGPAAVVSLLHPALCFLVFRAGRMAGGYAAGTGALGLLAVLELFELQKGGYNFEQTVYTFFLLLVLCSLLAARRRGGALAAGLAVGMSVMARAPLFFFPPVFLAAELAAGGGRGRRFLARAALFLAASYVLLLPWGRLNLWLEGQFTLVNRHSAADNVITGALGAVYTMEGESRELAGLRPGESAEIFFFRTLASDPAAYAAAYAGRLWHVFLFSPFLFGSFLVSLFFLRDRSLLPALSMPVFFVLVYCAFSIEARYFLPMGYVMPPLIAASVLSRGRPRREPPGRMVRALYLSALAVVLAVEALVVAYPARAEAASRDPEQALASAPPEDRTLRAVACGASRESGGYEEFLACMERYSLDFPDDGIECSISAMRSSGGMRRDLPGRNDARLYCLAARSLRALELGDTARAEAEYERVMSSYQACCALLREEPYQRDRELGGEIRRQTGRFWERYFAAALAFWPPERRARLAAVLRERFEAPAGLDTSVPLWSFAVPYFGPTALDSRPGGWKVWSQAPEDRAVLSKELADEAVTAALAGRLKEAESLLDRALKADPLNPEALVTLCSLQASSDRPRAAADSCGRAFCSVHKNPARHKPGRMELALAAAMERRRLLLLAGRGKEAAWFARDVEAALAPDWPRPDWPAAGTGRAGRLDDPCRGLAVN
ncbi:MAG: hypothetical protein RQ748_00780 [Elusimicrobiales bacterium]|nr:hypothetical protein [Elusimicrobiales bacterium]